MKRKVYNVSDVAGLSEASWIDNVEKEFIFSNNANVDIITFPGGSDVNPKLYGENLGKYTRFNNYVDEKQIKIFNRIQEHNNKKHTKKILSIGICRGAQLLTVLSGGRLIQHVTNHMMTSDNNLIATHDGIIEIKGDHHQMMYPYELEDNEYEILGWSHKKKSDTYLDGNDCEIPGMRGHKEPEIVYYKKTHALCIQAHPEWGSLNYQTHNYLNLLVNDLIAERKPKNLVIV